VTKRLKAGKLKWSKFVSEPTAFETSIGDPVNKLAAESLLGTFKNYSSKTLKNLLVRTG
jgi:hypothetical protein